MDFFANSSWKLSWDEKTILSFMNGENIERLKIKELSIDKNEFSFGSLVFTILSLHIPYKNKVETFVRFYCNNNTEFTDIENVLNILIYLKVITKRDS